MVELRVEDEEKGAGDEGPPILHLMVNAGVDGDLELFAGDERARPDICAYRAEPGVGRRCPKLFPNAVKATRSRWPAGGGADEEGLCVHVDSGVRIDVNMRAAAQGRRSWQLQCFCGFK